ncbi:MAG: hypothetical protein J6Z17_01745 [Treponema sp.]|nr:hypothetical protein [Treponema sp.]
MKRGKKLFIKFFILVLLAGTVFTFGWMNLFVNAEGFAVMVSKTSGVNDRVISRSSFTWKWQHLIPTNVTLVSFNSASESFSNKIEGTLPSGALYASHIGGNPDFNYKATVNISLSATEEKVLSLYKDGVISDSQNLSSWLSSKALELSQAAAASFFDENYEHRLFEKTVFENDDISTLIDKTKFYGLDIKMIKIEGIKLPDFNLYNQAKSSYTNYLAELEKQLKNRAENRADEILEDDRIISRLERFALVVQKYPEFGTIVKSQEFSKIIDALR